MGTVKGKNAISGGFLPLPHRLLRHPKYYDLSPSAVKLLVDLGSQYKGGNNGDLTLAWKIMQPKGWHSEWTLNRAKKELLAAGFITETRKGRLPNVCSLYAINWRPLDFDPKFDISRAGFRMYAWEDSDPLQQNVKSVTSPTAYSVAKRPV